MSMFRYVVECNRGGQILYLENDATMALTQAKCCAQQFLVREVAIEHAKSLMADKRRGIKRARAVKIAPGREVPYVNC